MLPLPEIEDDDGDQYTMRIDNFTKSGLYMFTQYSAKQVVFSPTDIANLGDYRVTLILKDTNVKPLQR